MTVDEAQQYVLRQARARGVAAEVLGQQGRELTARAYEGRVEQMTQARQGGFGVRVVADGRVGYAYSEELSSAALDWMLDEAIENAGLQSERTGFLPDGADVGRHDLPPDVFDAPLEAKVQAALGLESTLREDGRVRQVMLAGYAEREWEVSVASTQGAAGRYRRGLVGMMGSVVMQQGESVKQAWDAEWGLDVQGIDPGRTALMLTERTGRLLGARPLKTGRYVAYFEPKAFADLLAAFWPLWSGKAVMEGKSRLAGRLGDRIGSPLVTVIDDPTLADGLARRPFDAEGAPARPLTLLEGGILKAYFTNSETARALNHERTGHAARSYRSPMTVSPSNFYMRPGAGVTMGRGVLVTELMGVHAGTNAISGEFSVQAFGLVVEDGEVAYPVENFAVAGDFLALLQEITALGETLEWEPMGRAAFGAPLVEVAGLSFAGT